MNKGTGMLIFGTIIGIGSLVMLWLFVNWQAALAVFLFGWSLNIQSNIDK